MSSRLITENDLKAILESMPSKNIAGEIKTYAGLTVPTGWLECDGHEELIEDYPLLAAALSADHPDPNDPDYIEPIWGTPTSYDSFVLPDLTGRVPVGYDLNDTAFDAVGKHKLENSNGYIGTKTVGLGIDNMPAHNHGRASLTGNSGGSVFGGGQGSTSSGIMTRAYSSGRQYKTDGTGTNGWYWLYVDASHTHTTQGSGTAHNNIQPYAVVKYIICAQ